MSNEEKILEMLMEMKSDISGMKGDISGMKDDIAEIQTTLTKVAVTQEAVVLPKIQLLFDGHVTLKEKMDTLASRSRMAEVEDDLAMLKDAVKLLRIEVEGLKMAQ